MEEEEEEEEISAVKVEFEPRAVQYPAMYQESDSGAAFLYIRSLSPLRSGAVAHLCWKVVRHISVMWTKKYTVIELCMVFE